MYRKIGIREEDKYELERRAPLVPSDIEHLIESHAIEFTVQGSEKRIFSDQAYEHAGAFISRELRHCDLILGVKEIPESGFEAGKAYLFFSHVIKGQAYNMPMLKALMEKKCTLIDYERVADSEGRRLIFFGRYAGLAGMINTLWAYGQRMKVKGHPNAFSSLKQAFFCNSLSEAKESITLAGQRWVESFRKEGNKPLVIAVTGDGNVSQGALEIMDLMPVTRTTLPELGNTVQSGTAPLVLVNIRPGDYLRHSGLRVFDLQHYIDHPEEYHSVLETWLSQIDIFVNGIYWDPKYPKLITKKWLKKNYGHPDFMLQVIGDITCDVHGSVECTEKATDIQDPVFMYDPAADSFRMGFEGDGITVMAVDILPSELPVESSEHFSSSLKPFITELAACDYSAGFDQLGLPEALKRAVIVHNGELTPSYQYLRKYLSGS
ncbi:MAG: hypothetical protein EA360_05345 [Balneolaceae bacterium]|nr:MAG: hypothetical protein EA360_05345 [Balneolaceae bacterium]